MSGYILEKPSEAKRLEKQNSHQLYCVNDELQELKTRKDDVVLDAGCGTGVVTKYFIQNTAVCEIDAIDFSRERLDFARDTIINTDKKVNFTQVDLNQEINLPNKYDLIVSRFVMHHLESPLNVIKNLSTCLKKQGEMVIIDSDGVFFNLYCRDKWVLDVLEEIKKHVKIDMFVGRKLKSMMVDTGLKNLSSRLIPMHFQGDDLLFEKEQYRERFSALDSWLQLILGTQKAQEFQHRYLEAFDDSGTEIFYNKFIVRGIKC